MPLTSRPASIQGARRDERLFDQDVVGTRATHSQRVPRGDDLHLGTVQSDREVEDGGTQLGVIVNGRCHQKIPSRTTAGKYFSGVDQIAAVRQFRPAGTL